MPELADIFRAHGPDYLAKYGQRMLPSHKKALRDITACRTEELGGQLWWCKLCDEYFYSYHSCCNRHCPKCKNDAATEWIAKLSELLLPVPYFLVTVTLPATVRPVARRNQKCIYNLLFRQAVKAIQKLARDPQWVGGKLALIGVLQTWTRDMRYHVHIHFIVPGGALSDDRQRWLPAQRDYLMPEQALAPILRGKFRDALKKLDRREGTELFHQVPKQTWRKEWVVDIIPVGSGQSVLKYLAPYIFRVAISNKRIVRLHDGEVTFKYKPSKSNSDTSGQIRTLPAEKFISRFLQHVLPRRFVKVRYYGFYSCRKRSLLESIKELFHLAKSKQDNGQRGTTDRISSVMQCRKCGRAMMFVKQLMPLRCRSP